jgi:SAM-dependent methyltransferase
MKDRDASGDRDQNARRACSGDDDRIMPGERKRPGERSNADQGIQDRTTDGATDALGPDAVRDDLLAWDQIAGHWDAQTGEGNDFHKQIILPAMMSLLDAKPGAAVLDCCCGNGWLARRLSAKGFTVHAFDGSAEMIRHARDRDARAVCYAVADACDADVLDRLYEGILWDAATASLALMDLPVLGPVMRFWARRIRVGGAIVCAVSHPAFYSNEPAMTARQEQGAGEKTQTFAVEVSRYLTAWPHDSRGLLGQPVPHRVYHRSLQDLLAPAFAAGLTLDGLIEPSYAWDKRFRTDFAWARRPDIPPVLAFRLRRHG